MILKRIKNDMYDKLCDEINDNFFEKTKDYWFNLADKWSEVVKIDNCNVNVNIDIDKYKKIFLKNKKNINTSLLLASQLFKDFFYKNVGGKLEPIPENIMFEKEVWAYLNLTIFFEIVETKYFDKNDVSVDAIRRFYLNDGAKIDRTGLRYLWILANSTYYKNDFELTKIAIDFIDPFKAIHEGVLGKNKIILKALALAIKKLKCNPKIKNKENRTLVPKHIRNFACSIFLDGYDNIEDLSDVLADQIKIIINR